MKLTGERARIQAIQCDIDVIVPRTLHLFFGFTYTTAFSNRCVFDENAERISVDEEGKHASKCSWTKRM